MDLNDIVSYSLELIVVILFGKRDFVDVTRLRILRWGYYPGL